MLHQSDCGGGVFDALGNQLKVERFSQSDDRANNRQIVGVSAEVTDKSRVDLERIDWKGLQVRQDGVTGAEVVDGDLDPNLLQLREGSASGFDVANHSALSDLQAHRVGMVAELVDGVRKTADETGMTN